MVARILILQSVSYGLVFMLNILLICRPTAAGWDVNMTGTCGNQIISYILLDTIGLLTDVAILATPLRSIWRLNTD